ncbi:hypothetical protein FB45DRAFT_1035956 [Roridomyces roridus]|uniref:Uncharacterized protein n=1 Tax=Roridomyces roridus TaxID=1738132 RepID=A0AAD7BA03_9AGAR|nr:hypothetical protein FB45DRAFT_1035956 [Roridomyces roridus]
MSSTVSGSTRSSPDPTVLPTVPGALSTGTADLSLNDTAAFADSEVDPFPSFGLGHCDLKCPQPHSSSIPLAGVAGYPPSRSRSTFHHSRRPCVREKNHDPSLHWPDDSSLRYAGVNVTACVAAVFPETIVSLGSGVSLFDANGHKYLVTELELLQVRAHISILPADMLPHLGNSTELVGKQERNVLETLREVTMGFISSVF